MQKKIFALGAVATAIVASLATVQAAVSTTETVGATHNLYYTGKVPKNLITAAEVDGSGAGAYTSTRMAMDLYPASHPRAQCAAASPTDTNLTCYGAVPVVVDLSTFVGSTVHIKVSGTVGAVPPVGTGGADPANGVEDKALIGLFVKADETGATGGVSHDGLADLAAYSNAVPTTLDVNPTDTRLDNDFFTVGFRSNRPGFEEVGGEFQVVVAGDLSGSDYVTSMTIPTVPATATHLLLAYNVDSFEFDATVSDTFSVTVADNAAFSATQIPPVISAVAVTKGSETLSLVNGAYQIFAGDVLSFAATAAPGTDGSVTGPALDADDYAWELGGTAVSGQTSASLASQTFSTVGSTTVKVTVTDSASESDSETVTVNVQSTAPTSAFTAVAGESRTVVFTNTSSDPKSATLTNTWSFGGAGSVTTGSSDDASFTYTYDEAGDKLVSLAVNNGTDAAVTSATQTVTAVADVVTSSGGGGGAMSLLFGLGLLLPAFVRRRLK